MSMANNDGPDVPTSSAFYDERAQRISNMIDEELRVSPRGFLMLLGQAESGKSTLQKQFQLYYASPTLDGERPSWRPVVYFNIIKAVRMILSELDYEFSLEPKEDPSGITEVSTNGALDPADSSIEVQREIGELRVQLLPLVAIEDTLASELSGGVSVSGGRTGAYVRSGWQALVTPTWPLSENRTMEKKHAPEVILLAAKALASTSAAVEALWNHRVVKRFIQLRKIRLDESASFFLENLTRIAEPDYVPTNTDILNVRLQTLGIMEHTFPINMGGLTYDWKLYDVGGAVRPD
ncbi:guanine nucleotide binding protein, alpha subunit [Collybia nuda]|uniref:Guanine nucleotide binding protein, alpha subunit n=1 Tax=Collybia nuda TaxID=64659 RepID=A0A9P6CAT7_9AGAR|nr:guanine nucleotide binding protein, alpha subunit [Collybia nuda]